MNRREAIMSTGAILVSASAGAIACGAHNAVAGAAATPTAAGTTDHALADAAHDCVHHGDECIQHCIGMLASGDTAMIGCLRAAQDMVAVSEALAKLALAGSAHLPAIAKAAVEMCTACEAECRKHAGHHEVCRACADACAKTVTSAKKYVS
jgi:Cys-rich four helix bundle protein (predicted Tat secretion target)